MTKSSRRAALVVAGAAALIPSWSAPASANGKFPAADQLVVDPSDPGHLVVRTTFGILTSRNGGADWHLICEAAAGYQDYEPGIAVAGDGAIIIALYEGVGLSTPDGCGWSLATGVGSNVADVSVWRSDASRVAALSTEAAVSGYFASTDHGKSFTQVSSLPQGFAGLTIDVMATVDPPRVYVSGVDVTTASPSGKLARSDDGGVSWQLFDIPGSDGEAAPYIGAIHPTDPDQVWVRLAGPGRLLVTFDGGSQWTDALTASFGALRGFALSPDGSAVLTGTEFDGLWRADVSDLAFEKIAPLAIRGLTWTDDHVYALVNELLYGDGFIVGASSDDGASFEPLVELACVRGPLDCPSSTPVGAECPAVWTNQLSLQLGVENCGMEPTGAGGSSTGGGGLDSSSDGCGCRVVNHDESETGLFALLCASGAGLWRTLSRRTRAAR